MIDVMDQVQSLVQVLQFVQLVMELVKLECNRDFFPFHKLALNAQVLDK